VYCQYCGTELNQGAKFCHNCGAKQMVGPPTAPPERPPKAPDSPPQVYAPPPPVQGTVAVKPASPPQKKRRGCCGWGCLVGAGGLVVILLLVGLVVARETGTLEQVGLYQTPTERLLEPMPDRAVARRLLDEKDAIGMDTTGMYIYVFPFKESSRKVAYVVLDKTAGFKFDLNNDQNAIIALFSDLANTTSTESDNITRIVIDYRDGDGADSLLRITAPVEAINDYNRGVITREEFLQEIDTNIEPQDMLGLSGEVFP